MLNSLQESPTMPTLPEKPKKPGIFAGARSNWRYVIKTSALALVFWAVQFVYQYYVFSSGELVLSLIRSFAFSGATLISIALIIGPLARLSRFNYIFHRRTFGVWGFTFVILHYFSVFGFVLNFDSAALLWDLNPFVNLMLFGLIAFWVFLPLYITSTDWATQRLGFKRWKNIHRLVYFAYIFAVIHYTQINPAALGTIPGYLLLLVTVAALAVQTIAFVKTIRKTQSKKAVLFGSAIILLALVLFYIAFAGVYSA